jgi:hypothetical protein
MIFCKIIILFLKVVEFSIFWAILLQIIFIFSHFPKVATLFSEGNLRIDSYVEFCYFVIIFRLRFTFESEIIIIQMGKQDQENETVLKNKTINEDKRKKSGRPSNLQI